MTAALVIEDWRPLERNTLRGFCRVRMPSGVIFHDVAIHRKDEKLWVSPPGRPAIGRDGTQIRKDGKLLFNPAVTFADRTTADKFGMAVIEALRAVYPDAVG